MPPVFEPLQIFARIRHPVGQRLAAEGFVWPEMEVFLNAEFPGQFGNGVQRVHRVVLPAFARGENFCPQTNAHARRLRLDARHVLGAAGLLRQWIRVMR